MDENERLEKELKMFDLIKENLDWFSTYKIKNNIRIREDDQLWFESIIHDEDFKQQIITKYRTLKLKRILKNEHFTRKHTKVLSNKSKFDIQ